MEILEEVLGAGGAVRALAAQQLQTARLGGMSAAAHTRLVVDAVRGEGISQARALVQGAAVHSLGGARSARGWWNLLGGEVVGSFTAKQQVAGLVWACGHADSAVGPAELLRSTMLTPPALIASLMRAEGEGWPGSASAAEDAAFRVLELAEACGVGEEELASGREAGALVLGGLEELRDELPPQLWASVRRRCLRQVSEGHLPPGDPTGALRAYAERTLRESEKRGRGELTWLGGLPGVGKSSWARAEAESRGVKVVGAEGARRRDRQAARSQMWEEALVYLGRGEDVVVDATHLTRSSRDVLLHTAERTHARVRGVWFSGSLGLSLERQEHRPWRDAVAAGVIRKMCETAELPGVDEYDELVVIEAEEDAPDAPHA